MAGEYWYRPGEFLVHEEDVGRIEDEFPGYEVAELTEQAAAEQVERAAEIAHVEPRPVAPAFEAAARRRLARFRTTRRMDVPALVEHFRERPGQRPEDTDVRVAPHYVLMGVQSYMASPADDPEPADAQDWSAARDGGHGVMVAVLDTGLAPHPALEARAVAGPGDAEVVDEDGDGLRDEQAGHGTFIAGRVLARAGGVTVQARRVLDSWGISDELTVAAALEALEGVQVVNLSLGCYTQDNTEPLALSAALAGLPREVAVVAAAGNYAKSRPFWPAALKRCVAVAAVGEGGERAAFTNYGSWVDACAPGVKVTSTFLRHTDPPNDGEAEVAFEGWARWSGTSFAAPYVAAAIATRAGGRTDARDAAHRLLRESNPHADPGLGVVVV